MSEDGLNVVIPMGGLGSRFSKHGYRFPKPLLNIAGRPVVLWLLDNLSLRAGVDTLWIVLPEDVEESFMLSMRVRKEFPKLEVQCVQLNFQTRGAAETLFAATQHMGPEHLKRRTISLDCDTIYFTDILQKLRELPRNCHASFYFIDEVGEPVFSYLKLEEENRVTDIREKEAISRFANTGAYAFASGLKLQQYAEEILSKAVGAKGEYYTSGVLSHMIRAGEDVRGVLADSMACVGTPKQMYEFLVSLQQPSSEDAEKPSGLRLLSQGTKRRFCFDLDGTLVSFPQQVGDYSTVLPIWRNIELVRQLHRAGHTIIIQTARRMKTHGGNVAAAIADIGRVTFDSLDKFGIPYDEIIFGKPWADVYVDDNAVHAQLDTYREIGWAPPEDEVKDSELPKDFVAARSFHSLVVTGEEVIKTGPIDTMKGEAYFYENMPKSIKKFFPEYRSSGPVEAHPDRMSLSISLVDGVSLAKMMLNRCVTVAILKQLLDALHSLHTSKGTFEGSEDLLYSNYAPKLQKRIQLLNERDKEDFAPIVEEALWKLKNFEEGKRAIASPVIHGDPVFSNILVCKDSSIKLLDMRGSIADQLTLGGDALYDFAKVYQSLIGYDLWMHETPVPEKYLSHLQTAFWDWLKQELPSVRPDDIRCITACLLLSAAPLHGKTRRISRFAEAACGLLNRSFKKGTA